MIKLNQTSSGVRIAILFLGLFALVQTLVILKEALVPFCLAIICSIMIQPIVNNLVKRGMNLVLAISIPLFAILGAMLFLIIWISSQFTLLIDTFPIFIEKWDVLVKEFTLWISDKFGLSSLQTDTWRNELSISFVASGKSIITPFLLSFGELLIWLVFIPVYTFMILYYRPLLVAVVFSKQGTNDLSKVQEIYKSISGIIRSYLQGLLLESSIVACLNSIGLLVLGLDYAILLGMFGGALNVIPYVGGVVSALLPMLVALATKPIIYVFYILIQFIVVQFLDNNLIMPRIVASKVQVNGLVSVFVVVLGGMMWGVTGMFLSIPFSAILKVTLDHYKGYEAWGRLLGNEKLISES